MADTESALSELGAAVAATDSKLSSSLGEILAVGIQELSERPVHYVASGVPLRGGLRRKRSQREG
jgi:hypothetical protein